MKIFLKTTGLKTLLCLLGNFIIGVGVAFIKSAAFGIDTPLTAAVWPWLAL